MELTWSRIGLVARVYGESFDKVAARAKGGAFVGTVSSLTNWVAADFLVGLGLDSTLASVARPLSRSGQRSGGTHLRTGFHFVPQTIESFFLKEMVDEREECQLNSTWCADLIQSRCVAD